jgi:hypothetical protein
MIFIEKYFVKIEIMDNNLFDSIENFQGKTFIKVDVDKKNDCIYFFIDEVVGYKMYHEQDCCENVYIKDISGDLEDLVGSEIIMAECETNSKGDNTYGSHTWTFYRLATAKGYVTISFYGSSNGYYSEGVSIIKLS